MIILSPNILMKEPEQYKELGISIKNNLHNMLGQESLEFPIWPLNTEEIRSCLCRKKKSIETINMVCPYSKKARDVSWTSSHHPSSRR